MNADEFADPACGRRAGVGRGFDRSDVASHDGGHEAGIDFLPANEDDVRGLDHRVGRFNHADQPAGLHHSERVANFPLFLVCHGSGDSTPGRDRKLVNYALVFDEEDVVDHVGDDTCVVGQHANAIAGLAGRVPHDPDRRMFF